MVTYKRRIASEQDRFGGYAMQPSGKTVTDETEVPVTERFAFRTTADEPVYTEENRTAYETERTQTVTRNAPPPVVEYSQRPVYGYTVPAKAPRRAKKQARREKEDLMPSIRTRAYAQQQEQESEKQAPRARLSGKAKAALVAYAAVTLLLAALVISVGLAVSNLNARSAQLEREIAQQNERLLAIDTDIAVYTDLDRIAGAAMNDGMHKIEHPVSVDLVPTTNPVSYESRTNWFDKLCDWLSKIIGG